MVKQQNENVGKFKKFLKNNLRKKKINMTNYLKKSVHTETES